MDDAILDLDPNHSINCIKVGREAQPLLTVKNFLNGASFLREHAIRANQFSLADNYYPGIRMDVPLIYTIAAAKNVETYINDFFGLDLKNVKKAVSRYSIVTTAPRDLGLLQKIPHFDAPSQKSLAMVHFLCGEQDTGTALYRHRSTSFEYVDTSRYLLYMDEIKNQFSDPSSHPQGYIYGPTPEFDLVHAEFAEFNKVIMYHGSSLHSGIIPSTFNPDPSPSSGRLTITTFVEFKDCK